LSAMTETPFGFNSLFSAEFRLDGKLTADEKLTARQDTSNSALRGKAPACEH
jgi:hypothetical protein